MVDSLVKFINFSRFYLIDLNNESDVNRLLQILQLDLFDNPDKYGLEGYLDKLVENVITDLDNCFDHPEEHKDKSNNPTVIIDFAGMLYYPVIRNIRKPSFLNQYLDYVLVDESQDLNKLQQRFVNQLNNGTTRYIFVGDEKQAIYGFAGADTHSIENIKKEFTLNQLPLNISYRCPQRVITLAQQMVPEIEYNPARKDKGLIHIIPYTDIIKCAIPGDMIVR